MKIWARGMFVTSVLICLACTEGEETADEREPAEGGAANAACCQLGAACHVVGDATDPEVTECHEIGHENDPNVCEAEYERCMSACEGTNDDPVEHACE